MDRHHCHDDHWRLFHQLHPRMCGFSMIRAFVIALLLGLASPALAQLQLMPGDPQAPKYGPPGPWCLADMGSFAGTEPAPSSDGHSGWVYSWDVVNQCFSLRPPALLTGPGALPSNISLTQNTFTPLDGAIGAGGFRPGLAQYPPAGEYI